MNYIKTKNMCTYKNIGYISEKKKYFLKPYQGVKHSLKCLKIIVSHLYCKFSLNSICNHLSVQTTLLAILGAVQIDSCNSPVGMYSQSVHSNAFIYSQGLPRKSVAQADVLSVCIQNMCVDMCAQFNFTHTVSLMESFSSS